MLANVNSKQELNTHHQAGTISTLHWVSPARSDSIPSSLLLSTSNVSLCTKKGPDDVDESIGKHRC